MGGLNDWKKRAVQAADSDDAAAVQKTARRSLAAAAGAEDFQNRDPVYHVTEDFHRSFDLIGREKARALAESGGQVGSGERSAQSRESGVSAFLGGLTDSMGARLLPPSENEEEQRRQRDTGVSEFYSRTAADDSAYLSRFSSVAFNHGKLSGAVVNGTGRMMLVSCLKRAVGQKKSVRAKQRKLFGASSSVRNVSGSTPDKVIFNRGAAGSAVGLVVDVLRDARQTVDELTELASGKNVLGGREGADTLTRMYPFLSDEAERAQLEDYSRRLALASDPELKDALARAIAKTQALIERKSQMKFQFIATLRSISDNAVSTLELFSQPGFTEDILDEIERAYSGEEEPPPDKGGGAGGKGKQDASKRRAKKERREGGMAESGASK